MFIYFAISASAAFVLAFGFFLFQFKRRTSLNIEIPLRPNCLLTKTSLMILSQPESLFRLKKSYQIFLKLFTDHGYTTFWRKVHNSRKYLIKLLDEWESNKDQFHFFADEKIYSTLKQITKNRNYSCVRSLNLIDLNIPGKALD